MNSDLSPMGAVKLYETIYLIRQCENKIREEYKQDQMKTPVHLCIGAEAIHAGVIGSLPTSTKVFGTYRNHGIYLAQTGDTDGFFAELYGKATGCAGGRAGSMHMAFPEKGLIMTSAVVATTISVAVGAAFANAYRGDPGVVAVFFGDGAFEEGSFWESINFACLHRLRILFVCEDNGLAIHTPACQRQGFRSIPEVMGSFKCHVAVVKGQDAGDVVKGTQSLLKLMNEASAPMPGFLYAPYLRFLEHVGVNEDFHSGYRAKPGDAELSNMDPLLNAERLASSSGAALKELGSARHRIDQQITKSVEKAKKAPFPEKSMLFDKEPVS